MDAGTSQWVGPRHLESITLRWPHRGPGDFERGPVLPERHVEPRVVLGVPGGVWIERCGGVLAAGPGLDFGSKKTRIWTSRGIRQSGASWRRNGNHGLWPKMPCL